MTTNNRLIHFIKEHEPDMFDLLEKMVLIQSGSHNKEGVDRVAGIFALKALDSLGLMNT